MGNCYQKVRSYMHLLPSKSYHIKWGWFPCECAQNCSSPTFFLFCVLAASLLYSHCPVFLERTWISWKFSSTSCLLWQTAKSRRNWCSSLLSSRYKKLSCFHWGQEGCSLLSWQTAHFLVSRSGRVVTPWDNEGSFMLEYVSYMLSYNHLVDPQVTSALERIFRKC